MRLWRTVIFCFFFWCHVQIFLRAYLNAKMIHIQYGDTHTLQASWRVRRLNVQDKISIKHATASGIHYTNWFQIFTVPHIQTFQVISWNLLYTITNRQSRTAFDVCWVWQLIFFPKPVKITWNPLQLLAFHPEHAEYVRPESHSVLTAFEQFQTLCMLTINAINKVSIHLQYTCTKQYTHTCSLVLPM